MTPQPIREHTPIYFTNSKDKIVSHLADHSKPGQIAELNKVAQELKMLSKEYQRSLSVLEQSY